MNEADNDLQLVTPVHTAVPGRARLRAEGLYRSTVLKCALESVLNGAKGVRSVSASIQTGNLLVIYDPARSLDEIVASVEAVVARNNGRGAHRTTGDRSGALALGGRAFGPTASTASSVDEPAWHALSLDEIGARLGVDPKAGVPAGEVEQRLAHYGLNQLAPPKIRSPLSIFVDQFKSLPVLLLAGSAVISILTGGAADAVVIGAVVLLNAGIGFATELNADRTVTALLHSPVPNVTVIRDGRPVRVSGRQVAPGDLVELERGAEIVADARLIECSGLSVDESALTGESMPVRKSLGVIDRGAPLAKRSNMVYRETVITGGTGMALIVATGTSTEIGRIQALISEATRPETPIQRQLDALGSQLVVFTGIVSGGVLLVGLLRGFTPLEMLRCAVSLAVAAVPEGLPAVATTALASGIRSLRRQDILVRRMDAVETLGAVDVVCLDKTGTLTANRMSVLQLHTGTRTLKVRREGVFSGERRVSPDNQRGLSRLIEVCALCNEAEITEDNGERLVNGSPTEGALVELAWLTGVDVSDLRRRMPTQKTEPRTETRCYMKTIHELPDGRRLMAVKGSPKEVLALCDRYANGNRTYGLSKLRRKAIRSENKRMAREALRVLGAAFAEVAADGNDADSPLIWLGLVGIADPTREGLRDLLKNLRAAGVRPMMITGDQKRTAAAIGAELELSGDGDLDVLGAGKLARMTDEELAEVLPKADIFARVSPSDKLKIVQALQRQGRVVAMTGDGINDGPALKAADIGITLGEAGSQVAREVADVVLRNDNVTMILPAILEGRGIHSNIRKAVHYIAASNASEITVTFTALAAGLGQPFNPRQLLWINLLSDVFPEIALATQAPAGDLMRRPPVDPRTKLIGPGDRRRLVTEALVLSAAGLMSYGWGFARYGPGLAASTMAFLATTAAQLLHALSSAADEGAISGNTSNRFLAGSVVGGFGVLGLAFAIPGVRTALGITRIGWIDMLVSASTAAGSFVVNEGIRAFAQGRWPVPGRIARALPPAETNDEDNGFGELPPAAQAGGTEPVQ